MKLISLGTQLAPTLGMGLFAMGIMDFMDDEEGDDVDAAEASADGGDGLFDDDMGGMDGDVDGGMDDDMGMGMDDGMGDWAEGGDEFGDMGEGGGAAAAELENRVDELENEVANISSTMSTVRSENEQISEKVDDIEENVRKLLEIYEMVTKGVNPFVDDVQGGGMGGGAFGADEGGFGLFDDGDGEADSESDDDLDDDIASADADSFFDDDAFDEMEEAEDEMNEAQDEMDEMSMDADLDDAGDADEEDDSGQATGTTFEDLKAEYESGEADWADEDDAEVEVEVESEPEVDASVDEDIEDGVEEAFGESDDEFEDVTLEPTDEEPTDDSEFEFDGPTDARTEEAQAAESTMHANDKPYLTRVPSGYVADLVVLEWLEFLIDQFGGEDAARAITYYADIGWISDSVEAELLAYASGIADIDNVDPEETGPATLEIDDHIQSLTYMSQLTGDAIQRQIVDHCAAIRGEGDGIQR